MKCESINPRRFSLDEKPPVFQIFAVQSGVTNIHNSKCKRDLDSVPQPCLGTRLNTSRQARAACGVVGTRIASTLANRLGGDFHLLNRADCVKAGCSLIRHVPTRSVPPHGSAGRSMENITQNRIARKGAGDGRGTAETPAHELSVNEAHTRSNAKAGQTPAEGGADRRRNRHKRTTSRDLRIKEQAVRVRARATGRKACPEMVAAFPLTLDASNKPVSTARAWCTRACMDSAGLSAGKLNHERVAKW